MLENIFAFSATSVGYNHIKVDKVCEDSSDFYDDEKMHICVVADGHGSDNYPRTDRGSKFAVDAAISSTVDFVNTVNTRDLLEDEHNNYAILTQLAKNILMKWYQSIEEDYKRSPFTEVELEKVSDKYKQRYLAVEQEKRKVEKAYGCTLIMYVVTENYSFGMQIGDGKCVVVDRDGNFSEPIPWDEDCQMNVTTSICDSDAIDEFRFFVTESIPTAVFCGSDGIDDSYASSEELYALYRSILKIFIEHGDSVGKDEIKEYLPVLTKKGSGDDVSIGLIFNPDRAKSIAEVFDIQTEIFNLSGTLKEKKHQLDTYDEKDKALSVRVRKWLDSGEKLPEDKMDDVRQINEIRKSKGALSLEVTELEEKIARLYEAQKSVTFDTDVASFETEQEVVAINDAGIVNEEVKAEEETKKEKITQSEESIREEQVIEAAQESANQNASVAVEEQQTTKAERIIISDKTVDMTAQVERLGEKVELSVKEVTEKLEDKLAKKHVSIESTSQEEAE